MALEQVAELTPTQKIEALDQQVAVALEAKDFKAIVALAQERNKLMDAMIKDELRTTTLAAIKEELAWLLRIDDLVDVEAIMRKRQLGEFVVRFRLDLASEARTANTESPLKAHVGASIALVDAPTKSRTPRSGSSGNGGTPVEAIKDGLVLGTHKSVAAWRRHYLPDENGTAFNVDNKARRLADERKIEERYGVTYRQA